VDIDVLPAGAELDWLVLHHALDWKQGFPALGQAPYTRPGPSGERVEEPGLPPVSTTLAEAWRLVAHVETFGLGFSLTRPPGAPQWEARVWREAAPAGEAVAEGETAALAIARAVLKAVQASLITKGYRHG
jgi:hypothetical protein